MPFPQNMIYIRYEFAWQNTEIQDTGLWAEVVQEGAAAFPGWGDNTMQALADKAVNAWVAGFDAEARFSASVDAVRAVVYHYDQSHNEVLDRSEAAFTDANAWGGTASNSMPPQNSVVLSLYGYDPAGYTPQRGRKRGRMYLPTPAAGDIDATGKLTVTIQQQYLDMGTNFMNALTGQLDIPDEAESGDTHIRPVVNSVAGSIATRVGWLRVGRVVDTQRRRRNKLSEDYLTGTINT